MSFTQINIAFHNASIFSSLQSVSVDDCFENVTYQIFLANQNINTKTNQHHLQRQMYKSRHTVQKFEKLNSLVNQIHEKKRQSGQQDKQAVVLNPRQISSNMSEKVLQMLKTRIKTNYDKLYSNYQDNKYKILKQIHTVETNIAGQNSIHNKLDEGIKEKARCDKLKVIVDEKQRKLKKLNDIKEQFKQESDANADKASEWSDVLAKINSFEQKKEQIEHQTMILNQMLRQRKQIHLNIKKRYNNLLEDLNHKDERGQKIIAQNLKKKHLINKIEEQLQRQEEVQIPPKLAEELSTKIQMYENKHSYNTIINHEAILEEERFKQFKQDTNRQREQQKNNKAKKENEQKNQLEQLYNIFLIKNIQEEKIKRLCGVQNIQEILNNNLNLDKANLDKISSDVNRQIEHYQQTNNDLEAELQNMMIFEQKIDEIQNIDELTKMEQQLQKDRNLMKNELDKKINSLTQCQIIMQFISPQQHKQTLSDFINIMQKNYLQKVNYINETSNPNTRQAKFTKIPLIEQEQSQELE